MTERLSIMAVTFFAIAASAQEPAKSTSVEMEAVRQSNNELVRLSDSTTAAKRRELRQFTAVMERSTELQKQRERFNDALSAIESDPNLQLDRAKVLESLQNFTAAPEMKRQIAEMQDVLEQAKNSPEIREQRAKFQRDMEKAAAQTHRGPEE